MVCIGHGVANSQSLNVSFKNSVVQENMTMVKQFTICNGNKSTSIKIHIRIYRSVN